MANRHSIKLATSANMIWQRNVFSGAPRSQGASKIACLASRLSGRPADTSLREGAQSNVSISHLQDCARARSPKHAHAQAHWPSRSPARLTRSQIDNNIC